MAFLAGTRVDGDITFTVLSHDGGGDPRRAMEAWIAPAWGSNLCRFTAGGTALIDYQPSLLKARDFTGTPVLYPTPNRVRGGAFTWDGASYRQEKRGSLVLEHGLVHSEPWQAGEPAAEAGAARLETWIDFREGEPVFTPFPFPHRLGLEFRLTLLGITVTYTITNTGTREIPFGFGLHPYFTKVSGDGGTWISLPARSVMDATSDLLPTGRLVPVIGTVFDLRKPVPVGALDLDHVFTEVRGGRHACIQHRGAGLAVELKATPDFSHLVLYTPRGERYFCLENQTCSTDAHNLYDRGFAGESGLKTVKPGAARGGSVTYAVRFD
jgi:aldose 1-epimerase